MSRLEFSAVYSHFKSIKMLASEILACKSTLFSLLVIQPAPSIQADKFCLAKAYYYNPGQVQIG